MELRSSRSRSKTPFVSKIVQKEVIEQENHVEETSTVTRTTRRTTKSNDSFGSSGDMSSFSSTSTTSFLSKPSKKTKSEKKKKFLITSDYSSEDGDYETYTNKSITQNEKNQILEDARALANGSGEISALDLYRSSDRYWDKYPKTDYTYSRYSRDRFEIAPGEVIMPNMSRRNIHDVDCMVTDTQTKSTNTEGAYYRSNVYKSSNLKRANLFNNNLDEGSTKTSVFKSLWWKTKRRLITVITTILSVFYFVHRVQTGWFAKIHRFCSWVMLVDTWLMKKNSAWRKGEKVALLVLLPLLVLGAWWLLSSLGGVLYTWSNSTAILQPPLTTTTSQFIEKDQLYSPSDENQDNENTYLMPPKASEIAAGFSRQQLDNIADAMKSKIDINEHLKTEDIVEKILSNPRFINIINNHQTTHVLQSEDLSAKDNVINALKEEISKIRNEIEDKERERKKEVDKIIADYTNLNAQSTAKLSYQLKRCCRKSIVNVESYVNRAVTNFLNNADFLNNQRGFAAWLKSVLLAREEFESHIANATQHLDAKFEVLLENNGKMMMDDIANKITLAMNKVESTDKHTVSLGDVTDERIKKIVRDTLYIYDADKTGLVDYAMEPMGGQIITTRCTENYHSGKAVVSVLGIPLWYPTNTPRTVITPGINPGECWAFENFPGFLVIQLSSRIEIEAFSLEHVNKLLVPNGRIDSAPKNFEVYGLNAEKDKNPVKLGEYLYDYNGDSLQFFPVQNEGHEFQLIEIRITSNHGNPNYTCLYRFRVHGKLSSENR